MSDTTINLDLVHLALGRVDGSTFEKFANAFYSSIAGENFIPLGGVKDGGADAFQADKGRLGERTSTFYQASIEENHRSKIKRTIDRLREFERLPKRLIYLSSQTIKHIDVEEYELSEEHGIVVSIRDRLFIVNHINDTPATRAAFITYLEPTLSFLRHIGATNTLVPSKHVTSPAIFVFLRQELERHHGKDGLVNALADGLILWALEETDPEQGVFMTENQIRTKISDAVPAAAKILKSAIPHRLVKLSSVSKSHGRAIRWYRKQGRFCLAHEFRQLVAKDNASDEMLRISVRDIFVQRLKGLTDLHLSPKLVDDAANISLDVIQKIFENQGLEFAAFVERSERNAPPVISDYVGQGIDDLRTRADQRPRLKEAVLRNLQGAFYASDEAERIYFSRLSSTYTLLFCLNTEPRIVEYFQNMAADFYLYVGADLIVRALSERYLHESDQHTRNAFRIIQEVGGRLILSESALEEVHTHIAAADLEFINHYQQAEPSITLDIARHSDRILIRSYFYAKLQPPEGVKGPFSWAQFINQFCDYSTLHMPEGRENIKRYLMGQFRMKYEDKEDLLTVTNAERVRALAENLREYKKSDRLAENDALMALAIYGRRRKQGEHSRISEYGYRTWWLTGESRILQYTRELESKEGAKYIMRPEFLIHFLALAPTAAEIRQTYRSIFPSLLGIRLARRISKVELHTVLDHLKEAQELEVGRREAEVSRLSDYLKTKGYEKSSAETDERLGR